MLKCVLQVIKCYSHSLLYYYESSLRVKSWAPQFLKIPLGKSDSQSPRNIFHPIRVNRSSLPHRATIAWARCPPSTVNSNMHKATRRSDNHRSSVMSTLPSVPLSLKTQQLTNSNNINRQGEKKKKRRVPNQFMLQSIGLSLLERRQTPKWDTQQC